MEFPKLLSNIGLILVSIVSGISDTPEITFLPSNTRPLSYNISLIPHLEEGNFTFYGEINVIFEVIFGMSSIFLHSQELEINKRATFVKNNDATYKPVKHSHNEVTNILTLNFDDVLLSGLYTLHMEFVGNIFEANSGKNGFIKIPYIEKEENNTVFVTVLKPNHARRIFPCWDEPALKATFDISVMHDQKYKVLSNMWIRQQSVEANGMMRTHFDTTPIMSTYHVGIVIFKDFHVSNGCFFGGKTVNVWHRRLITPQIGFVHSIAEKITFLLVRYTNISEKISKMDHVIVYNYPSSDMEHWGLIIYNELIIYDRTDSIFQRNDAALLVAHQVVHQWFGNLVTPFWWSYLWLSEGFAEFFGTYFLNQVFDEERLMDLFVVKSLQRSLALDDGSMQPVILEPDNETEYDMFGFEVRYKAPVLLRMLQHAITDEVFQKGIRKYLVGYQFRSTTSDDLWSAMQSAMQNALDESYSVPHNNYSIKEVMDTWTFQKRYPILNVTRNYDTGEVGLTQKCCLEKNDTNNNDIRNKWWIPITYTTQIDLDFSTTVPVYWLSDWTSWTSGLEVRAKDWIIVNVQQTAYYRVYYDTTNWYKIIRYLNSEKYRYIHVLNRAQLIDDAYAFWMEKQLSTSLFLDLINYLSRETDYVAWYPMFRILTSLLPYYPLPESKSFKSHMVAIFDKLLQIIGYQENPHDANTKKMLRLGVLEWACTFGHAQCKDTATNKLNAYLWNPNTYKVPQGWQDWTYCFGLATSKRATWDIMFELCKQTQDKKCWNYLSCSENPDIIIHYLSTLSRFSSKFSIYPLFDDKTVSSIYKIIIEKHANNGPILGYIFTHLRIRPRPIITNQLLKYFILNVYSKEQLDKLRRYARLNQLHSHDFYVIFELIRKREKYLKEIRDNFKKIWET